MEQTLEEELTALLNRRSQESASDTPDFILSRYLLDCLETWNKTIKTRENWHGRPK